MQANIQRRGAIWKALPVGGRSLLRRKGQDLPSQGERREDKDLIHPKHKEGILCERQRDHQLILLRFLRRLVHSIVLQWP